MDDREFEKRVYIPSNLRLRLEIFSGFGIKEFVSTLIIGAITIFICLIIYNFYNNITFAFVLGLSIISFWIMGTLKDKHNMSFFLHLKRLFSYLKEQKEYDKYYIERWTITNEIKD